MKRYNLRFFSRLYVLVVIASFLMTPFLISAAETDSTLSTRDLAMINKPGVVLVQSIWTADITLYEFGFTSSFEDDIYNTIVTMVTDGTIPDDEQSMYSAMVQLMIQYMPYYTFSTGNIYTETTSVAGVGTGFIVTPDGYMVTNAHVVTTDEEELSYSFVTGALQDYAIEGTNGFVAEMRTLGYEMTQDEIDGMLYAFYDILSYNIGIDNLKTSYSCYMGNVTPGSDVSAKGVGLDLRKIGEPVPGKDVAILKLDKTNLPTVTLGDDSKLRTGDKVYAMGYPALATLDAAFNVAQAIQEPTLTSGIISARKEMAGGWSILQTDASIHGGNSGGPLFNEAGEVIGVNTFGMLDPDTGAPLDGMNFAIPISIALQFLNEINVRPSESQFTTNFKKALSLFKGENYSDALEILRGLNETNPGYPVVAELLAEARTLADQQPSKPEVDNAAGVDTDEQNKDSKPAISPNKKSSEDKTEFPILWIGIAGGAVIVILLVVVVILLITKKKQKPVMANTRPNQMYHPSMDPHAYTENVPQDSEKPAVSTAKATYCTNCGAPIALGTKFCGGCGAKF